MDFKHAHIVALAAVLCFGGSLAGCKSQSDAQPASIVVSQEQNAPESQTTSDGPDASEPDVKEPIPADIGDDFADAYETDAERDAAVYSEYLKANGGQFTSFESWYAFVEPRDADALKESIVSYLDGKGYDTELKVNSSLVVEESGDGSKTSYAWVYPRASFEDADAEVISIRYVPSTDSSEASFEISASDKGIDEVRALVSNVGATSQPSDGQRTQGDSSPEAMAASEASSGNGGADGNS